MSWIVRIVGWTVFGVAICTVAVVVVLINGWGFGYKTLFDWLDILIFPSVLAVGVYWLNLRQSQREREIADQSSQDAALQAYLDQMSHLLLDKGLRNSGEDDEVRTLARARTLTVLAGLDPQRKGSVLQFLYETNLIDKENPVVRLGGISVLGFISGAADLKGITLSFAYLGNADLSGTGIASAHLAFSHLSGANLSETDLSEADLEHADLTEADLGFAVIGSANLYGCILSGANLEGVNFWNSNLKEADLSGANLQDAELAGSIVAQMTGEDIRDANLTGADLTEADLRGASITEQQLVQCKSLRGATMPDGSKYEDWLKTHKKDGSP